MPAINYRDLLAAVTTHARYCSVCKTLRNGPGSRCGCGADVVPVDVVPASTVRTSNCPRIICLCGSSRYIDVHAVAGWLLEKQGNIVLGLHLLPQWYTDQEGHLAEHEGVAEQMDELHLRKIDLADEVVVVNFNQYYGDSTKREIDYAAQRNIPVKMLYPDIARELCMLFPDTFGVDPDAFDMSEDDDANG